MSINTLLDTLDEDLAAKDQAYLDKYKVDKMMSKLMMGIVMHKPKDPVQYLIDALTFEDMDIAAQDKAGLSNYRRQRLVEVFSQMDKDGSGWVDFKEIQAHSSKYGGQSLSEAELREVFKDFDTSGDNRVTREEFLLFFGRAVANVSNAEFDVMIQEMLD